MKDALIPGAFYRLKHGRSIWQASDGFSTSISRIGDLCGGDIVLFVETKKHKRDYDDQVIAVKVICKEVVGWIVFTQNCLRSLPLSMWLTPVDTEHTLDEC